MKELRLGKPKIVNKKLFLKRVEDIVDSCIYSNNGRYVIEAEDYICDYLQVKHTVLVSNATIALEIAAQILKEKYFKDSSSISALVPSFTFVATVSSLIRMGINPIFVDIDKDYCMDLQSASDLSSMADMVVPVNLFGNLANEDLGLLAKASIFDCAQSFGCFNEITNSYSGAYGAMSVFSGHPTKIGGAFEGGWITTNDADLAERARELRSFGYKTDSGLREGQIVANNGTNGKMSEIAAAALLTQLENIQEIQSHYFDIHQRYKAQLGGHFRDKNVYMSNFSYVTVEFPEGRDKIIDELNQDGIFPRTYFSPLHLMEPFKGYTRGNMENTEAVAKSIMSLPTGLTIDLKDVDFICERLLRCKTKFHL